MRNFLLHQMPLLYKIVFMSLAAPIFYGMGAGGTSDLDGLVPYYYHTMAAGSAVGAVLFSFLLTVRWLVRRNEYHPPKNRLPTPQMGKPVAGILSREEIKRILEEDVPATEATLRHLKNWDA